VRLPKHPVQSARQRLTNPKYVFGRYLPDDPVIVEAGAYHGQETVDLAQRWPRGCIHAFEPNPDAYSELARNTAHEANITTYQLALGDDESRATFWLGGPSSSLLAPKLHISVYPGVAFSGQTSVKTTTLSAWASGHGIDRIDGMWLDLQGLELAALKSAGPLLNTTRAIVLEASKLDLYEGCPLWSDVRAWLIQVGFRVRAVKWDATGSHGDALAVRPGSLRPLHRAPW
jgi:FkbM family methyltransferase